MKAVKEFVAILAIALILGYASIQLGVMTALGALLGIGSVASFIAAVNLLAG
jgi:hypothetical protein